MESSFVKMTKHRDLYIVHVIQSNQPAGGESLLRQSVLGGATALLPSNNVVVLSEPHYCNQVAMLWPWVEPQHYRQSIMLWTQQPASGEGSLS